MIIESKKENLKKYFGASALNMIEKEFGVIEKVIYTEHFYINKYNIEHENKYLILECKNKYLLFADILLYKAEEPERVIYVVDKGENQIESIIGLINEYNEDDEFIEKLDEVLKKDDCIANNAYDITSDLDEIKYCLANLYDLPKYIDLDKLTKNEKEQLERILNKARI